MARFDWATGRWDSSAYRRVSKSVFLLVLIAGAFLVRLWGLSRMHFWDENVYLQNAEYIFSGKANYIEIDSRPPLLPIFFAGAFHLWHSDYAAWAVTALLNALGPAFLYLGGRKIAGEIPAQIAALLLAFVPFYAGVFSAAPGHFVTNYSGHSLLTDCPALTMILLAFWLLLKALEKQTIFRFSLAGFSLSLAVLMRFGSLSSIGMLSLLVLAANRRVRAILACGAGFAAGMLPYLCWSRIHYGGFLETLRLGWSNFGGDPEPFFYYLGLSAVIYSWLMIAGLCLWVMRRAWETWGEKQSTEDAVPGEKFLGRDARLWEGFLWLWAAAVMIFFSSLSHKEPRYAMPAGPPLFLLAGIGLSMLLKARQAPARIAGTALLATMLVCGFWPVRHRFDSGFIDPAVSEEMTVSDFLTRTVPASTILYTNQNYPDFGYYTQFQVNALPETGDELYESLQHLPDDAILIAYRDDPASEPRLAWLDANPHYQRVREFPSLVLYAYHASAPQLLRAAADTGPKPDR